jgi:plasmid stabilization system protein ParE
MTFVFSRLALRDLAGIASYIEPRNPAGAARVAIEIERTIQFIADNPRAGAEILQRRGIRRAIVTRYPYLI